MNLRKMSPPAALLLALGIFHAVAVPAVFSLPAVPLLLDLEIQGSTSGADCRFSNETETKLANTVCLAYRELSSCSVESLTEKILLKQCCTCFELCCAAAAKDADIEILEIEVNAPAVPIPAPEPVPVIFPGDIIKARSKARNVRSASTVPPAVAVRRGKTAKPDPAGGKTTPKPTQGSGSGSETPSPTANKGGSGSNNNNYNLTVLISVAVREALNKFAHALINATEGGEVTTEKPAEVEGTTVDPCLEFSSGASKSQVSSIKKDIPSGLNCTELDPLDEFFPIKPGSGKQKVKISNKHKRSNSNGNVQLTDLTRHARRTHNITY